MKNSTSNRLTALYLVGSLYLTSCKTSEKIHETFSGKNPDTTINEDSLNKQKLKPYTQDPGLVKNTKIEISPSYSLQADGEPINNLQENHDTLSGKNLNEKLSPSDSIMKAALKPYTKKPAKRRNRDIEVSPSHTFEADKRPINNLTTKMREEEKERKKLKRKMRKTERELKKTNKHDSGE